MILHAPANAINQVFNNQEQIPGTRKLVLIYARRNNALHQLRLGMLPLVHANVKSLFHAQLQPPHGTILLVRANVKTNLDVVVKDVSSRQLDQCHLTRISGINLNVNILVHRPRQDKYQIIRIPGIKKLVSMNVFDYKIVKCLLT